MRSASRRSRAGILTAAALLTAGGPLAAGTVPATAAATAVTVPVQACPAEQTGPGQPPLAAAPASVALPDGVTPPPTAAVYAARYPGEVHYLVAPGGWTCDVAFFGADGGEQAYVHPGAPVADPASARFTSVVRAVFVSGGVQTDIDLACGFIPQAGAAPNTCLAPAHLPADQLHPVATHAPGLLLTAVGVPSNTREPNLPTTGGPDRTVALVVFPPPGGPAQEITCTIPAASAPIPTCQAALGHFLATGAAAEQLTPADLSAALHDLNAFVAAYLAQP
ncbi:hypothetical protein ACH4E7_23855 [Kitasatospora sp. NPDC018058]|uniref:hypothetical protein n=1 Tax=Kitasatospora sp. NPDC018058 TaxID=3364025 RepID=UPI0037BEF9A6